MAAQSLSSGPVMGVLSATGSSPVFSTVANTPAVVVIGLSRLASGGSAPALMRSTDGGSTWAPVTMTSPGPAFVPTGNAYRPSTFFSVALLDATTEQYRIDATISGGSVFYLGQNANVFPTSPVLSFTNCSLIEPGDANQSILSLTTSQLLSLFTLRNTPLTLAQIAPPLTLYKRLNPLVGSPPTFSATAAVIAKLTIPSGASVGFDNTEASCFGTNRVVRASSVQVAAVTDSNNNAVTSGTSMMGTVYTTGATVNAVDLGAWCNASTGPFSGSTCLWGVHAFSTELEAICLGPVPISLSAYGQ